MSKLKCSASLQTTIGTKSPINVSQTGIVLYKKCTKCTTFLPYQRDSPSLSFLSHTPSNKLPSSFDRQKKKREQDLKMKMKIIKITNTTEQQTELRECALLSVNSQGKINMDFLA